jgi:hypothetical protein
VSTSFDTTTSIRSADRRFLARGPPAGPRQYPLPAAHRAWRTVTGGEDIVTVTWRHAADDVIRFTDEPAGTMTTPAGEFLTVVR